tara:strand:+ start:570 stop:986 length:417 start_codon:yes stop_codon:yes gene_type:complete
MDSLGRIRAHRNLNARDTSETWSFYTLPKSARVERAASLLLYDVDMKQPNMSSKAVKDCILGGGHRSVFAWLKSADAYSIEPRATFSIDDVYSLSWQRLRFNPTKGQQYFQDDDGQRIDTAAAVLLLSNGHAYFRRAS